MGQHATIHGKNDTPANGADGTWQPIRVNAAGQINIALLNGELSQFNRLAGGSITKYIDVSASGQAVVGPCIVYGVKCISGTTPTFTGYDATSATGNTQIVTGSATAETFYPLSGLNAGSNMGVLLNTGFYATLGGTSPVFRVFYVDAV